jgi:hypothetical protein
MSARNARRSSRNTWRTLIDRRAIFIRLRDFRFRQTDQQSRRPRFAWFTCHARPICLTSAVFGINTKRVTVSLRRGGQAVTERLVRLIWWVGSRGYEIEQRDFQLGTAGASEAGGPGLKDWMVPIGGLEKNEEYQAGLLEHAIFRDLINSSRRPGIDGVSWFVNKWGGLTSTVGQPVEKFIACRDGFVKLIAGKANWNDREFLKRRIGAFRSNSFGPLDARLETKRGRPRIFFQARSLLQFCLLEYFHARMGNIDITACDACGELLPLHKVGRPKRYSDHACKMAAWQRAKR